MNRDTARGTLVISLDFELHWGVRDHTLLDGAERKRLLAARALLAGILRVFREHEIRATWATVGMLFARSRDEAQECRPRQTPKYRRTELDPYCERLGRDESDDPFHFAPSLIREVAQQPGQEVASHSYSHYCTLEAGGGEAEFASDLDSAKRIAENSGYALRSYVFPRNQVQPSYLPVLGRAGFDAYRDTERVGAKAPATFREQRRPWKRALRLLDAYCNVNGPQTTEWPQGKRPIALASSRYLRPCSSLLRGFETSRLRRIASAMKSAAVERRIFHLWWHPEDFAREPERNLDFLNRVLNLFDGHRREYGMASLSMGDVSEAVNASANGGEAMPQTVAGSAR